MKLQKIKNSELKRILPKRLKNANKTDYGHALIIGGSKKYIGAGILSTLAATRCGAGYVHLMSDLLKFDLLKYPDFILEDFNITTLKKKKFDSIAIGPGLGIEIQKEKILKYLIRSEFKNVVVDADAITMLANFKTKVELPTTWILTPHEGELARLLKVDSKKIKENRVKYLVEAQKKFKCHIILKGAETLLIDSEKNIYHSFAGKSCLAKAGSGDVLTGIIVGLLSQKLEPIEAMKLGVTIHGLCSQRYLKSKRDEVSMRPLDLIEEIGFVIKKLR